MIYTIGGIDFLEDVNFCSNKETVGVKLGKNCQNFSGKEQLKAIKVYSYICI